MKSIILLALLAATVAAGPFSISNVLGDHMVLQRGVPATVWGFGNAGVTVSTTFNGATLHTTVDGQGVWRQQLPATPAGGPHTISFTSSDGGSGSLADVLFGDVYLCGGQSNMQFTVATANNATAEIATASKYPHIRVFTVGQGTQSSTPLTELKTIEQKWAVGTSASIGGPAWAYLSAVCWFFGREIYDALGGTVPIGLVNNNWGGTAVQQWSGPNALAKCNQHGSGNLWNAMIVPYTIGPMAMKGATWYQGEANVGAAPYYSCQFPAMITDWRAELKNPGLWFGFVQLAGFNYGPGPAPADLRTAQLAALALPGVGYSTAIDVGDAFDIHPHDKQTVGTRLANSALAMVYGQSIPWQYPLYSHSTTTTSGTTVSVTVYFQPGTQLTTDVPPYAKAVQADVCVPKLNATECGTPTIQVNDARGTVLNANAALTADKSGIVLTATAPQAGLKAITTSYGRASWPVCKFYNVHGLPVIPWYSNVTTTNGATLWALAAAADSKLATPLVDNAAMYTRH